MSGNEVHDDTQRLNWLDTRRHASSSTWGYCDAFVRWEVAIDLPGSARGTLPVSESAWLAAQSIRSAIDAAMGRSLMSDETQYTLAPEDEALLLDLIHREDVLAAADEREGPPPSDRRERSRRLRGMLDRLRGGAA